MPNILNEDDARTLHQVGASWEYGAQSTYVRLPKPVIHAKCVGDKSRDARAGARALIVIRTDAA